VRLQFAQERWSSGAPSSLREASLKLAQAAVLRRQLSFIQMVFVRGRCKEVQCSAAALAS